MEENNIAELLSLDNNILDAQIDFIKTDTGFKTGVKFLGKYMCFCGEDFELIFGLTIDDLKNMIDMCEEKTT